MMPTSEHVASAGPAAECPEIRKLLWDMSEVARIGAEADEAQGVLAALVVLREKARVISEILLSQAAPSPEAH